MQPRQDAAAVAALCRPGRLEAKGVCVCVLAKGVCPTPATAPDVCVCVLMCVCSAFTHALLMLYSCFTLLCLRQVCVVARDNSELCVCAHALLMLYSCFTHALLMLYSCSTHALLMLYSCFTQVCVVARDNSELCKGVSPTATSRYRQPAYTCTATLRPHTPVP